VEVVVVDLDKTIDAYHAAAGAFARGDPEPVKALWSRRDDVTLANPFGPAVRGWTAVSEALDHASSRFRDGEMSEVDRLATYTATDLLTMLEREWWKAKVGGDDHVSAFELRVTSTFRLEDEAWKLVHRHADPIATSDPRGPLRSSPG